MNYALPLGLFWVFRYLFAIGGDYNDVFTYLYRLLSIGTPIIYYIILVKYKEKELGGRIQYGECLIFSLLLFIFASIPECAIMCFHLYVLNPQIVANQNNLILSIFEKMNVSSIQYDQMSSFLSSYGGIYYTACTAFANFIVGFFLSLILGYFVSRNNPEKTT